MPLNVCDPRLLCSSTLENLYKDTSKDISILLKNINKFFIRAKLSTGKLISMNISSDFHELSYRIIKHMAG